MKINAKLVKMLLKTNHFEIVGQLDMYGNGKILEVNTVDKFYLEKSNYQGTSTNNVILADNVKKEVNQFIGILKEKDYKELQKGHDYD